LITALLGALFLAVGVFVEPAAQTEGEQSLVQGKGLRGVKGTGSLPSRAGLGTLRVVPQPLTLTLISLATGEIVTGTDMVGAVLPARLGDATPMNVIMSAIDTIRFPGRQMFLLTTEQGDPICGTEVSGNPMWASVIDNGQDGDGRRLSNDEYAFACMTQPVAKCWNYGYPPIGGMARYSAACVRMVRADYCGDGTTHTVPGVVIDMGDNLGINTWSHTPGDGFVDEAEWGVEGATCLRTPRWGMHGATHQYVREHCPSILSEPTGFTPGSAFANPDTLATVEPNRPLIRSASKAIP
jgi:hypothetical protein